MPYRFQGQRSNEEVVLLTRQHPLVLMPAALSSAAILLLPWLVLIFTYFSPFFAAVLAVCLLLAALNAFKAWHAWHNSVALLTTERIVMLQQRGMLHRHFAECGLQGVRQVSHEVSGLLRTVFGFGSIDVYTAGAPTPFTIPNVPDPYEMQQEIQRLIAGEGLD